MTDAPRRLPKSQKTSEVWCHIQPLPVGLPFRALAFSRSRARSRRENLAQRGAIQSPRFLSITYNFSNTGYIGRGPAGGGPIIDPLSGVLTPAPREPGVPFRKASLMATMMKKKAGKSSAKKKTAAKKGAKKKTAKR